MSVTKDDFVRALAAEGITMDDHRMSYHIRMAELSGTLCSGNLHPQKATYSLVRTKIGQKSAHLQSSVFKLSKDLIDSIHEEGIVAYTS